MTRREPEELLGLFEGPQPRSETTLAIMEAARNLQMRATDAAPAMEAAPPAASGTVETGRGAAPAGKPEQAPPARESGSRAEPAPGTATRPARSTSRVRPSRRWLIPAAAACIAAAIVGKLLIPSPHHPTTPSPHHLAKPLGTVVTDGITVGRDGAQPAPAKIGDQLFKGDDLSATRRADIRLSDGSTVRLDRAARLVLNSTPEEGDRTGTAGVGVGTGTAPAASASAPEGERLNLALRSGRIFLRVTPAARRLVVSGTGSVAVLGTAFGVDEHDGQTFVYVIDGRVAVTSARKTIDLARGQSGIAYKETPPAVTAADPDRSTAWARDPMRFENRPLADVLDWLTLNSSYRFTVSPESLRQARVTAAILDEPTPQVIDALALACQFQYSINAHDVMINKLETAK